MFKTKILFIKTIINYYNYCSSRTLNEKSIALNKTIDEFFVLQNLEADVEFTAGAISALKIKDHSGIYLDCFFNPMIYPKDVLKNSEPLGIEKISVNIQNEKRIVFEDFKLSYKHYKIFNEIVYDFCKKDYEEQCDRLITSIKEARKK